MSLCRVDAGGDSKTGDLKWDEFPSVLFWIIYSWDLTGGCVVSLMAMVAVGSPKQILIVGDPSNWVLHIRSLELGLTHDPKMCWVLHREDVDYVCSRCNSCFYCSEECQLKDPCRPKGGFLQWHTRAANELGLCNCRFRLGFPTSFQRYIELAVGIQGFLWSNFWWSMDTACAWCGTIPPGTEIFKMWNFFCFTVWGVTARLDLIDWSPVTNM